MMVQCVELLVLAYYAAAMKLYHNSFHKMQFQRWDVCQHLNPYSCLILCLQHVQSLKQHFKSIRQYNCLHHPTRFLRTYCVLNTLQMCLLEIVVDIMVGLLKLASPEGSHQRSLFLQLVL